MSDPWASPAETSRPPHETARHDAGLFGALGEPAGAGFGIRALARILDGVFAVLVSAVAGFTVSLALGVAVGLGWASDDALAALESEVFSIPGVVFGLAVGVFPAALSQWIAGVTPGKLVLGLRVVKASGTGGISFGQSLGREYAYFIDGLFFALPAYFSMQESARAQRLGDKWAGTMVRFRRDLAPDDQFVVSALFAIGVGVLVALVIDAIGLFL